MSTSGTYNFTFNKSQILARSFQMVNIIDPGSTPSADDYNFASDILNMMLKAWEAEGIKLWKRRQAVLFTALNQNSYQIGSVSGSDNVSNTYVATTLSVAATASTSITVTSVVGMSINDNVGIELNTGVRQWTTITNINTGTNVITLNAALTSASIVGNTVVTYTNKINRPLRILRATTLDLKNNNNEVTMQDISYDEYFSFPIKTNLGRPNNFYYDRLLNGTLPFTGTLYIYPQPQLVSQIMIFTYCDSIQDLINSTENIDFPQEWLMCICTNLAVELASWGYGKFVEVQSLQAKADKYKTMMENFDTDSASLTMSYNWLYRP